MKASSRSSVSRPLRRAGPSAVAIVCLLALVLAPGFPALASTAGGNDCDSGQDAAYPGVEISPPIQRCQGFDEGDHGEWFLFDAQLGDDVWIHLRLSDTFPEHLCIYSPDYDFETYEGTARCGHLWADGVLRLHHVIQEPGEWKIRIASDGPYELSITLNTQNENSRLLAPHDTRFLYAPGVNELVGPSEVDGIDGEWVELDKVATGNERILAINEGTPESLPVGMSTTSEVRFYDADLQRFDGRYCEHAGRFATCFPPAGAAWAFITQQPIVYSKWFMRYHY